MFAGGGIAETYFEQIGIHIAVANELLPERASFYQYTHPNTRMICGDISNASVFSELMEEAKRAKVEFILATPPCQGMSTLGRKEYENDNRNSLIQYVIKAIKELSPKYVLIENVPKFIELLYDMDGTTYFCDTAKAEHPYHIVDLLELLFNDTYEVEMKVLNAMNYGVPQSRPRVIIKLYKKGLTWPWPKEESHIITLREAIGNLPSLESGQSSGIKSFVRLLLNTKICFGFKFKPKLG